MSTSPTTGSPHKSQRGRVAFALKLIGTEPGHEARGMVVSDDGSLSFPGLRCQGWRQCALPTAEAYDMLSNKCQIRTIVPGSDRSDFTSGRSPNLGDAVSVRNSRPHVQPPHHPGCGYASLSRRDRLARTYTGFLLLLSTDDMLIYNCNVVREPGRAGTHVH
jgi:hypothetical protein